MAALARQESDSQIFVGQVFARSSPVLTWRPALAAKAAREAADEASLAGAVEPLDESSGPRLSCAPTRRLAAWPVVARAGSRSSRRARWFAGGLVAVSLAAAGAAGLALALCRTDVGTTATDLAVRDFAPQTVVEGRDVLLRSAPLAPARAFRAAASPHAGAPDRARPTHRNRVHPTTK